VTQCRKLPSQERLEVLLSLAKDESLNVRYSALSQLSSVGAENPRRTLEKIREVLREEKEATLIGAAADVLFSLPLPEVFDELVALYEKTSDWIVRLSIVAGIGELKHPRSFEFLAQALESKDDLVISTAIGALGELGDKRALELLEPLLDSTDATIRDRAYNNIQRLKEA
jgi:HEAT repeat protein